MNNRFALYLRSIRGPILLITIGVLFAIHEAGNLTFSRTWPLILIVLGVLILLERMAIRPGGPQGGPYV